MPPHAPCHSWCEEEIKKALKNMPCFIPRSHATNMAVQLYGQTNRNNQKENYFLLLYTNET